MLLPVTIRAYQDTLFYLFPDPIPTAGESVLRYPEVLSALGVMKFERILTTVITTDRTFTALILDRFLSDSLSALHDSALHVLATVSVGSFVWHIFSICDTCSTVNCSTAELRRIHFSMKSPKISLWRPSYYTKNTRKGKPGACVHSFHEFLSVSLESHVEYKISSF